MGSLIRPFLIAAPLLLAAPVMAQQGEPATPGFSLPATGNAPPPDSNRQGPELNVYRDPPTQNTAPPPVAPTILPPPVAVQPAPTPDGAGTRRERREPRPAARSPERAAPADPAPQSDAIPSSPPPPETVTRTPPSPTAPTLAEAATPSPAVKPAPDKSGVLPWIVGLIFVVAAAVGSFTLMGRRSARIVRAPEPLAGAAKATDRKPLSPTPPPEPVAPALHVPAAPDPDRPWIDMDLSITQARFSLIGVTIAYSLHITNRGDDAAQDVMVRGIVGNAGAQQQALLDDFLSRRDGLPLHSVVAIAPGEVLTLKGELRLGADRIQPVTVGQRPLLIPLAAFDATYHWEAGEGRTARAFVVGQEQEPPADRLAPLRLDQGPRQYRRPAARAAAELTPG